MRIWRKEHGEGHQSRCTSFTHKYISYVHPRSPKTICFVPLKSRQFLHSGHRSRLQTGNQPNGGLGPVGDSRGHSNPRNGSCLSCLSKKNHFTFKPYSLPQLTMNQHSEALHVHVTNSSDSVGILNKYLKRSSRMSLMKLDLENTSFSEYCEVMEPILCILLYTRHVLRKSLQQRSFEE